MRHQWRQGLGRTATLGQPAWRAAALVYTGRFPTIPVQPADIFVIVTLRPAVTP